MEIISPHGRRWRIFRRGRSYLRPGHDRDKQAHQPDHFIAGSGSGGDIIYLFQNDICGEQPDSPRHARAFGNLHALQEQIRKERRAALTAFHEAAHSGDYPGDKETAQISDEEFDKFSDLMAKDG